MVLELVTAEPLLQQAREIFREYQLSLGIDLCFQDFEQEMADLPGKYAPPQGRLYLAFAEGVLAGCIALRPIQAGQCEIKRLYVRPQFRGQQLGKLLMEKILVEIKDIGYRQVFLDTLPTMTAAQSLYKSLGFREVPPYCFNPVSGAVFMRLDL